MKRIFVNLKRFDVPKALGGICTSDDPVKWIQRIMEGSKALTRAKVCYLLPEALILSAMAKKPSNIEIGSQTVYKADITPGGNFGAFTSQLPAAAVKNYGCTWAMIGHSEERRDRGNAEFNAEMRCADGQGLSILYCVGEKAEEQPRKYEVIAEQLVVGLEGIKGEVVIGYEPMWAIGPGKTPPPADYIEDIAAFIKRTVLEACGYAPEVVYGGGLKEANAAEVASCASVDGGLVALTRFTGDIGFYPDELERIIDRYVEGGAAE